MMEKKKKLRELMPDGKLVVVPMDHGAGMGPIDGLVDMQSMINKVSNADAVLIHRGIAKHVKIPTKFIMHLNLSTVVSSKPNHKIMVSSVERASAMNADGVSVHVNIGSQYSELMLGDLGKVADACDDCGMPLLAMMYPRGSQIDEKEKMSAKLVKLVARIGAEAGADIVKTYYTGDKDSFREVVEGCPVPVVIAGGPKMDSENGLLKMIEDSMDAGGAGTSIGRNIFQHKDPRDMVEKIMRIVHG